MDDLRTHATGALEATQDVVLPEPHPAAKISEILGSLDEVANLDSTRQAKSAASHQSHLAERRLGIASSLFVALRAKHSPTASHCLRVALGSSSWAQRLKLSENEREELEIAALLHDVGKIGVPDYVISKPSTLDGEELLAMETGRAHTRNILLAMGTSSSILDIIHYASAWYDGSRHGYDRAGDSLPLGSRIISIVDTFDAMTTDHVYRRAYSRERAVAELYACAASQFDPALVSDFARLLSQDLAGLSSSVARRWLQHLQPETASARWKPGTVAENATIPLEKLFHQRLLDNMQDAVVFVDQALNILLWNHAAERLTGIVSTSVVHQRWMPSLVRMSDQTGKPIEDNECPLAQAATSNVQTFRRLTIIGRNGQPISVDAQLVPVVYRNGVNQGAALLLRDASRQVTLEERVESLHQQATRDPLTQVANRAEFDRVHEQLVEQHVASRAPCALIICDIDHFKKINDTYGHQAGDEALQSFARALQANCRPTDMVARYGGEEFAILCPDCDNSSAAERAEAMRKALANTRQPALNGNCMTASFGVTELQKGDSPETMFRRADRALYQAKDAGRNCVVQLGSGLEPDRSPARWRWFSWFSDTLSEQVVSRDLVTAVPLKAAAEKLRGFVADQTAEILLIDENRVVLRIDATKVPLTRRANDRPIPFEMELAFEERTFTLEGGKSTPSLRTLIHVTIRPRRQRDRRRRDVVERARRLLLSLKAYFVAQDFAEMKGAFGETTGGKLR
ncbi:MAG: diguanylate cyclase [Planctomycetes bacterium]|nr:diguanylate cyclase [Planctomycetota bacterium]